jgi:nonribosomal peptide synthetase CepC
VPDENATETAGYPLALRVDVSGNPTFRELQSRVKSVLREAREHEGAAFPRVLAELSQMPGRHPSITVAVSHHVGTSRNAFRRVDFSESGQMLDLDIAIEERDGQISGTIAYATNLFAPDTITSMAACWQNLLAAACTDPDRCISELPGNIADVD